ncbi:hypothetical protein [Parafrankia sp. BMG5.11]|uniref:hypothetical protein n=1 Tax=Parafrankia sp. BMG5.11 TaxID=222540 RepID=UPI00103D837C|nr:hypothetical protein [Parafrankia sp. BMG5.11]TCJ36872.1 hypothetical protein E0504_21585 [Parafrankia sp. BMG5.11]
MTAPTMPVVTVTTARQLVDAGACTPGCLLAAVPVATCSCRCAGRHHGALADVPVSVEAERAAA